MGIKANFAASISQDVDDERPHVGIDEEPAAPFLAHLARVSLAGESSFLVYNSAACPL
jgi:hypothetical protein